MALIVSFRLFMISVAAAALLVLAGCSHQTVSVNLAPVLLTSPANSTDKAAPTIWSDERKAVPGIPFYVKRGVCVKETAWMEPQYTLALEIAVDDKAPIIYATKFSRSAYLNQNVQGALALLGNLPGTYKLGDPQACPSKFRGTWQAIADNNAFRIVDNIDGSGQLFTQQNAGNLILAGNTAEIKAVVDYSHQYYLNGTTPWIGSSQVDAKIAADGTLSEGSAQAEDDTWSTILTTASNLVGDFTGASALTGSAATAADGRPQPLTEPNCLSAPGWPVPEHKVSYKVTLTTSVYKHDHTEQSFNLVAECVPEPKGVMGGNFTVTQVDESKSSKDDENMIEVNGKIKLPKKAAADTSK